MTTSRASWPLRIALVLGVGAGVGWVLTQPVSTHQGVNFSVTRQSLPLYLKAVEFLERHEQSRLLAARITQGAATDRQRVQAVFDWTHQHIQPTPPGWPIVDDHVWHIMIRGYGVEDQMADVLTTLCVYAGVPAYWRYIRGQHGGSLIVSYVKVAGHWAVIDMQRAVIFEDAHGAWLTPQQLAADPALSQVVDRTRLLTALPYPDYFTNPEFIAPPPHPLRAEQQMPWPRLIYELRRALRLEHEGQNELDIRPGGMLEP